MQGTFSVKNLKHTRASDLALTKNVPLMVPTAFEAWQLHFYFSFAFVSFQVPLECF